MCLILGGCNTVVMSNLSIYKELMGLVNDGRSYRGSKGTRCRQLINAFNNDAGILDEWLEENGYHTDLPRQPIQWLSQSTLDLLSMDAEVEAWEDAQE